MATLPVEWNVVIVGAWNLAILTPDGIRKRLFEAPDGTHVDVQVAIDRPAPHRVHYNGLTVTPASNMLIVSVDNCDLRSLKEASTLAQKALDSLPETPLSAAGINFRYTIEELPDELLALIETPIDGSFSDANYTIMRRSIQRGLSVPPGMINLELSQDQGTAGTLLLNFHLDSQERSHLGPWLSRTEEFHLKSQDLLSIMNIPAAMEGISNA
jgi:hypothetical protein